MPESSTSKKGIVQLSNNYKGYSSSKVVTEKIFSFLRRKVEDNGNRATINYDGNSSVNLECSSYLGFVFFSGFCQVRLISAKGSSSFRYAEYLLSKNHNYISLVKQINSFTSYYTLSISSNKVYLNYIRAPALSEGKVEVLYTYIGNGSPSISSGIIGPVIGKK